MIIFLNTTLPFHPQPEHLRGGSSVVCNTSNHHLELDGFLQINKKFFSSGKNAVDFVR